ncbi:hypothetical protein GCM10017782_23920 [Deinococcus ficus]|nr:hypothetical protein GCM10017782_23920 [Deinococcus ficus]
MCGPGCGAHKPGFSQPVLRGWIRGPGYPVQQRPPGSVKAQEFRAMRGRVTNVKGRFGAVDGAPPGTV